MRHTTTSTALVLFLTAIGLLGLACADDVEGPPMSANGDVDDNADDNSMDNSATNNSDNAIDENQNSVDAPPQNQLAPGVFELQGYADAEGYDDLEPFGALVGDARIVGLGENIHNSGGFLRTKARLTRYLIEEKGFRVIAFESEWTKAEAVSAWLETCEGDAKAVALASIRPTWHDTSLVELLEWACAFNAANPEDRIDFFGFNMYQPWDDIPVVEAFLRAHFIDAGEDTVDSLVEGLMACEGASAASESQYYFLRPPSQPVLAERYEACIGALDTIVAFIDDNAATLEAEVGQEELRWVRLHVESIRGWEEVRWGRNAEGVTDPVEATAFLREGNNRRDRVMAEIFKTHLDLRFGDDAKVVFSAHSFHLNAASDTIDTVYPEIAARVDWQEQTVRMGNWLEGWYGEDYIPIGLLAWRYGVGPEWLDVIADQQDGAPAEGGRILDATLHAFGAETLFIDLSAATQGDPPLLNAGEGYLLSVLDIDPTNGAWVIALYDAVPSKLFRGLIFVDESEPWEKLEP